MSLLKELKQNYSNLYDKYGNKRVEVFGDIRKAKLTPERLELLYDVYKIVMETDIIGKYTKEYIKDKDKKVKTLVEEAEENGEIINLHTLENKIQYDKRKLEAAFGDDCLTKIIYMKSTSLSDVMNRIDKVYTKYFGIQGLKKNTISGELNTDIISSEIVPNFSNKYNNDLVLILEVVREYTLEKLNNDKEFLGYYNYLTSRASSHDKREEVVNDKKYLNELLGTNLEDVGKLLSTLVKKEDKTKERQTKVEVIKEEQEKEEPVKEEQTLDNNEQTLKELEVVSEIDFDEDTETNKFDKYTNFVKRSEKHTVEQEVFNEVDNTAIKLDTNEEDDEPVQEFDLTEENINETKEEKQAIKKNRISWD